MMAWMNPKPIVTGLENIPSDQGCLLVVNHYKRPNFPTEWFPAAISATMGREVLWIMTTDLRYTGQKRGIVLKPLTKVAFRIIARTYGFIQLPSNPPEPNHTSQRGAAMRSIFQAVKDNPRCLLGLAPEGLDYPENTLGSPPPGAGRMIYHLSQMGLTILPIGIFEQDGYLKIQIGKKVMLEVEQHWEKGELDLAVRRQVMLAILSQLPNTFQYCETIAPI